MVEKFLVLATGKKNGEFYSLASRIISGEKENGDFYSFVDNKNTQREEQSIPIGTILEYETKRVIAPKQTLNINNKPKED